jgi:hypothetical protein
VEGNAVGDGEQPKCACQWECGYAVKQPGAYVAGHSPNARNPARKCSCGCGMPTPGQLNPYYGDHRPAKPRMVASRRKSMLWLQAEEPADAQQPIRLGVPAPTVKAAAPVEIVMTVAEPQGPTLRDQMLIALARRGGGPGRQGVRT